MKDLEAAGMRHQHERLKKPGRVREVPLHRAGIGHRLDLAILRAQAAGRGFRSSCGRPDKRAATGPPAVRDSSPGGSATVSTDSMGEDIGESPEVWALGTMLPGSPLSCHSIVISRTKLVPCTLK